MGGGTSGLYSGTTGSEKKEGGQELDFNWQREATGFLSQEKLEKHYDDHKNEFSKTITTEQYVERAKQFFNAVIDDNVEYFYDADGILYKYNKKSVEFGMCSSDGTIITFFRPYKGNYKRGLHYWNEQVVEHGI